MKAYSIHPQNREIKEIDIEILANTAFTFFNSILVDESEIITKHIVYSDTNAINDSKTPYFLGGQLLLGDSLVLGREDFLDQEVSILQKDMELLIDYEVSQFYLDVLEVLARTDLNLYRTIEVEAKGEKVPLNAEWVLSTFNIADERTKEYFVNELNKVLDSEGNVEEYMKKMAGLALNAAT